MPPIYFFEGCNYGLNVPVTWDTTHHVWERHIVQKKFLAEQRSKHLDLASIKTRNIHELQNELNGVYEQWAQDKRRHRSNTFSVWRTDIEIDPQLIHCSDRSWDINGGPITLMVYAYLERPVSTVKILPPPPLTIPNAITRTTLTYRSIAELDTDGGGDNQPGLTLDSDAAFSPERQKHQRVSKTPTRREYITLPSVRSRFLIGLSGNVIGTVYNDKCELVNEKGQGHIFPFPCDPERAFIASIYEREIPYYWDRKRHQLVPPPIERLTSLKLPSFAHPLVDLCFIGNCMFAATDDGLEIYDVHVTGTASDNTHFKLRTAFDSHDAKIVCLKRTADRHHIMVIYDNNDILIADPTQLRKYVHGKFVGDNAHNAHAYVTSASIMLLCQNTIRVFDFESGVVLETTRTRSKWFDDNSRLTVCRHGNNPLALLELQDDDFYIYYPSRTGDETHLIQLPAFSGMQDVHYDSTGKLWTAYSDGTVRVFQWPSTFDHIDSHLPEKLNGAFNVHFS